MVKRIFSIFHKEISGLHQAAYLLGFLTEDLDREAEPLTEQLRRLLRF